MPYVKDVGNHHIDKENPRTGRVNCCVRGFVDVEIRGIFI